MSEPRVREPWELADDGLDQVGDDSASTSPAEPPGLVHAGVLPRIVAYLIDLVIVAVVSFVGLTILLSLVVGVPEAGDTRLSLVAWGGIALVAAFYFVGFWTGPWQATPGMRPLNLKIATKDGAAPLTLVQAAIRVAGLGIVAWPIVAIPVLNVIGGLVLMVWPVILLVSTLRSPRRRGFHDRLAGSAVVRPGKST